VKIYTEIKRVAENRRVDWGGAAYQFSDWWPVVKISSK
jgi:hypothetical protein